MLRREQRPNDRYDSERNSKFADYLSKEIINKSSKHKNSRIFSNNKAANLNSSQMYSQPQIIKPRRGASIIKNNSKSKYADSMSKFRKEFIKDSYSNFDYMETHQRKTTSKQQDKKSTKVISIDEQIGLQQLHYQMVKLHQNVKIMQHNT